MVLPKMISDLAGTPLTEIDKEFPNGEMRKLKLFPLKSWEHIEYRRLCPIVSTFDSRTGIPNSETKIIHDGSEIRASMFILHSIFKSNEIITEECSFEEFIKGTPDSFRDHFSEEIQIVISNDVDILKKNL